MLRSYYCVWLFLITGISASAQIYGANSNNYDVKFYRCIWDIDPARSSISGSITTYFKPLQNLNAIELDAAQALLIDSVIYSQVKISFTRPRKDVLLLKFPKTLATLDSVTVFYHGSPNSNSFITSTHGITKSPIAWTKSQPYGAKDWWPCKQTLTDKADSVDIFIVVPKGNKATSNGLLKKITPVGNKLAYHWKERYPIATYLICVAVTNYSEYTVLADLQNGLVPVQYYTFPEDSTFSRETSEQILRIFYFYDSLFGSYPFKKEKYGHAQTTDGGGMENQTMTFVSTFDIRLLAHELAHSWFGNKVTCASWSDIWLNEGFAKYCEYLSLGYATDPSRSRGWLKEISDYITSLPNGSVYATDTTTVANIFDYRLSYWKGAYLLHMLRWKLGDNNFFNGIRNYLNDPQLAYSFARTSMLQNHLEKVSGQSLIDFFDQWFYGEGYPSYHVFWNQVYNDQKNRVEVSFQQTTSDPSVSFFEMPLPILFKGFEKDTTIIFDPEKPLQTFYVNLDFFVNQIFFDSDLHVLSANNKVTYLNEDIVVYPNPANEFLYVKTKDFKSECRVELYDPLGRMIVDFSTMENFFSIPITTLSSGIYILKITLPNKVFKQKIIKENK